MKNDVIKKTDPDKGSIDYHKGIQITWKDDVTQAGVEPGTVYVGVDSAGNIYRNAILTNNGDIVIAPGAIELYGILDTRNGHVYLADVNEAIIPVTPTTADPLLVEKRVQLDKTYYGLLNVHEGANDYVISANDGVRDLVQGVDFILHDGWVEFTDAYLSSFSGVRRVRINIGYRFLYIDVVGTKVEEITPVKRLAAPKTDDNNLMVMWMLLILSGMSVIGGTLIVTNKRR